MHFVTVLGAAAGNPGDLAMGRTVDDAFGDGKRQLGPLGVVAAANDC